MERDHDPKPFPKLKDLQKYFTEAQMMVDMDAKRFHDEGTCVLGAGIAVYAVPKGCRHEKKIIIVPASFQGNVGSWKAAQRAIAWLKSQGVAAFWCDGMMD
jgi:hypothetical protein